MNDETTLVAAQYTLSMAAVEFSYIDVIGVTIREQQNAVEHKLMADGLRQIGPGRLTIKYEVEAEQR